MTSTLDEPYIQYLVEQLKTLSDKSQGSITSSRFTALDLAKRLTEALETPQHAVSQAWLLPNTIACVKIAADLDLFNLIAQNKDKPRTAADLAKPSGAEPQLIVRIMRVLTAQGYAKEIGESTYACSPKTEVMTKPANVAGLRHQFNMNLKTTIELPAYCHSKQYRNPNDSFETPFQYALKTKAAYFEHMQQHPEMSENFDTFMQGVRSDRRNWLDWFPVQEQLVNGAKHDNEAVFMIDVGGGNGHDLMAFKKRFPEAPGKFILQDQPHVVKNAILDNGAEAVAHDIFTPQPVKGARLYFEHYILHDWDDESSIKILKHIATSMTKGYSKLYLNEWILPNVGCSLYEATMDIQLLLGFAGMERTQSQWTKLVDRAGLRVEKFWLTEGVGEGIVEVTL